MKFKKLIAFAMIGGLVMTQATPIQMRYVKAATTTAKKTSSEEVSQEQKLNDLLVQVKSVITIPSEYTVFNYSYNSYSTEPVWYFYWSTKDGNNYMSIVSDDNGHILNYYNYKYPDEATAPQYLQAELKEKADAFLKKIVKDSYSKLSYQSASYDGVYTNAYTYLYERTEKGIPVPDNTITVSIDSSTGEVKQFSSNWDYTVTFPSSKVSITKDKATELLKKELTMDLEYHEVYSSDGSKMLGELVYVPSKSYLAVDAKNGTIYDTRDYYAYDTTGYGAKEEETAASADSGSNGMNVLTEEEIKKIEEMAGLLTKKEAIKALKSNSSYLIDSKATTETASLSQVSLDPSNPDAKSYVWNITLMDSSEIDYNSDSYYQPYISASVDAKTGSVISFNANTKVYAYGVDASSSVKLTESEGLKKAETFLKKYYSSLYNNTEYTGSYDGYAISYLEDGDLSGGKVYTFTRVSNGVKFPSNQIYVGVDLVTGKIYSFNYNWYHKIQFESVQNTITASDALDHYLALDGYDLIYEITTKYTETTSTSSVRLVYRTDIQPYYIDAFTGAQVNYSGEQSVKETGYSYTDIDQSAYKRAILLLADMGIGFNSSTFAPDNAITKEEFNQLVQSVGLYELRNLTWSGAGTITREEAARYAIEGLNLGYIAKMDIFKVNYTDSSELTTGSIGYVVLADQLELLQSNNDNTYRPKQALTRGEAAQLILQMINLYQY